MHNTAQNVFSVDCIFGSKSLTSYNLKFNANNSIGNEIENNIYFHCKILKGRQYKWHKISFIFITFATYHILVYFLRILTKIQYL
jgi:hypothetical protein